MRLAKPLLLLVPALLLLASCSSTSTVSKADVEQQAIAELTKVVGQAPDSLTCPSDLNAEVGATLRCELTSAESTYGVTVTVTSVDGGTAKFDIVVDDQPTTP